MKKEVFHIAIDGPVASGKGTVARELAKRLGISVLDTGALYRAEALGGLEQVEIIDGVTHVWVKGRDVTDKIRTPEISQKTSKLSEDANVREKINKFILEFAKKESMIVEGRDIGTVVLPNAKYKFYLTADVSVRAKRRLEQNSDNMSLDEMISEVETRDKRDMQRVVAPLCQAPDAIVIDNTYLNFEDTINIFLRYII